MKRRSHAALILGLLLGLCWPGGTSRAEPTTDDKANARRLMGVAKRFIQEKNHTKAIEAFTSAYNHWPRKEIQFNIALVYLEKGDRIKAYEHLSRYWRVSTPEERSRLPAPLLRLRNELGTLRVRASDPAMGIRVGGTDRGKGSVELVMEPGVHKVEVVVDGEVVQEKSLRVMGGAEVLWEAEPPRPGTAPGAGATEPPKPQVPDRRKLHLGYFVAAASLAVAAGAVVIWTGVKTLQLGEDYDANPTRELQKEGRTYRAATNVMIGVSAAAAIGAAVLAVYTRFVSPEKQRAVSLYPSVAPGGGMMSLELTY
ncbi:MAG: hypothetical protein RBU30_09380 [Polyangia bacterium]|nr:hypothetical protein [Polyangia bacterium]